MRYDVRVQLPEGPEVAAGTLEWADNRIGAPIVEFRYARSYLDDARSYALSPDLTLDSGPHTAASGRELPAAFSDAQPDLWGRRLLEARARTQAADAGAIHRRLTEIEVLLAVPDVTRQGALRLADERGTFAGADKAVPQIIDLPGLLRAAHAFERGDELAPDMQALFDAGTSMGGARPKATVRTPMGRLAIAKLPRASGDFGDAMAWEATALRLAERCGIRVPGFAHHRIGDASVLVIDRFDRTAEGGRIGYLSANGLLQKQPAELVDYAHLADVALPHSAAPRADGEELVRRIALTLLINNVDDHLKNHGFVREPAGWRLSPVFDVNPHYRPGSLDSTPITERDDPTNRDIRLLIEASHRFGLSRTEATRAVHEVEAATRDWRGAAAGFGITPEGAEAMKGAFENVNRDRARALENTDAAGTVVASSGWAKRTSKGRFASGAKPDESTLGG